MSWAINMTPERACTMAITAETRMKKAIKTRMTSIFFRSVSLPLDAGTTKSSVIVEAEVKTSEESVDIDAESTSTSTTPMSTGARSESTAGIMLSKIGVTPSA